MSHQKSLLKMIFLFPRWDILIPWRVIHFGGTPLLTNCGMMPPSRNIREILQQKRREILQRISMHPTSVDPHWRQAVSKGGVNWRRWHRWGARVNSGCLRRGPFRLQVCLGGWLEGGFLLLWLRRHLDFLQENHFEWNFLDSEPPKKGHISSSKLFVCLFKVIFYFVR